MTSSGRAYGLAVVVELLDDDDEDDEELEEEPDPAVVVDVPEPDVPPAAVAV